MPETIGLLLFGAIVVSFVGLFLYLNRTQRIETGAEFARERGWHFQDVLPQFGRAQRQQVFSSKNPGGLEWELVINLQKSTTQAVPIASTIWRTQQIYSEYGLVLIGPRLDKMFDSFDFSNPVVTIFFQMLLGDEAEQLHNLHRLPIGERNHLTVLATDNEYGKKIANSGIVVCYQNWMETYKDTDRCPIFFLGENGLQFKVKKDLTKAAEADAFVDFCTNVAAGLDEKRSDHERGAHPA